MKSKYFVIIGALAFTALTAQAQEGLNLPSSPLHDELKDEPADEAPAAPAEVAAPRGPSRNALSVSLGMSSIMVNGAVELENKNGMALGVSDRFQLDAQTYLEGTLRYGTGSWEKVSGSYNQYDIILDWMQKVSGPIGSLAFGIGGRLHGLGPDDDKTWKSLGGFDVFTARLVTSMDAPLWTNFALGLTYAIDLFNVGSFAINKDKKDIVDAFAQYSKVYFGYAPADKAYSVQFEITTSEGAYELEKNKVYKISDNSFGLAATYRL